MSCKAVVLDVTIYLCVLHFQTSEGSSITREGNLAFQLYAKCNQAFEVSLLTPPDIDILCACIATEGVAMESRDTILPASNIVFFKNSFFKAWCVSRAVWPGHGNRLADWIV